MAGLDRLQDPEGSYDIAMEPVTLEPIAIIGYSLRFPQEADHPEAFWNMLLEGRCASTDIPADRLNIDAFYHPSGDRVDSLPFRGAHFLKGDIAAFDAPFFSITQTEASGMDPQQRLLLETTYKAIENAGLTLDQVAGSKTSVHTGCFSNDYTLLLTKDVEKLPRYAATGNAPSMLANRISWFFDLTGASVNLDSACSSSAMAVDLGCQSLWNHESSMGIVAGCNLIFSFDGLASLSDMNFLSHESRCFSFDRRASGYARGEGFAVVILKRLSDALKAGDVIRAVIRSTASNQDGRTPGITQPSKKSQQELIKHTYRKAGLDLDKTLYFESHGTGTAIGDKTEAGSIGMAFERTTDEEPLHIGALKSNIGHLEGASGVAAVVKTIMVLEKGVIPPNANFEHLNPRIDANHFRLNFPTKPTVWPRGLRRASVNCFGFGGANTHIVMEDAYHHLTLRELHGHHSTVIQPDVSGHLTRKHTAIAHQSTDEALALDNMSSGGFGVRSTLLRPRLLVFSSADERGVDRLGELYVEYMNNQITQADETFLDNLAYTLSNRRTSFAWKSFVVANSMSQLKDLRAQLTRPRQSPKKVSHLGFIFTGQGSQYIKMGKDLLAYTVYENTMKNADTYLQSLGSGWSLIDEMLRDKITSRIDEPALSQPLCTALQIGLVNLLRSFNVSPSIVVGHSSGEIAAAYSIGAISAEAALKIAYFRGLLASEMEQQGQQGAMLAVGLPEDQVTTYFDAVAAHFGSLSINVGCVNSPYSVTISGNADQVEFLQSLLEKDSVFCRKLRVKVAYHSSHMRAISESYLRVLQDLRIGHVQRQPMIMISSVTGNVISRQELQSPGYWASNLVSPVRFVDALRTVWSRRDKAIRNKIDGSHRRFQELTMLLEVGPHSTLQGPVRDLLQTLSNSKSVTYASLLVRNKPAMHTLLEAAGTIHCAGYNINIHAVNSLSMCTLHSARLLVDLPQYPFDHSQTYWTESTASKRLRFRQVGRHDLLGTPSTNSNPLNGSWRGFLKLNELPWMKDHKINGSMVYPAAGMMAMAIEGAKQMATSQEAIKGYTLKDVIFHSAIQITAHEEGTEVHTYLTPFEREIDASAPIYGFKTMVCDGTTWTQCCSGTIQIVYFKENNEVDLKDEEELLQLRCADKAKNCRKEFRSVDYQYLYESLDKAGYGYGPFFQPLRNISCNDDNQAMAEVDLFEWLPQSHFQPHVIHPTTIDGVFQLIFTALSNGGNKPLPTIVPAGIRQAWISATGLSSPSRGPITAHTASHWLGYRSALSTIFILGADRQVCAHIEDIETARITKMAEVDDTSLSNHPCYRIEWRADPDFPAANVSKQSSMPVERTRFYQNLSLLHKYYIRQLIHSPCPLGSKPLEAKYEHYYTWLSELEPILDHAASPESKNSLCDCEISCIENIVESSCSRGKLSTFVGRNLSTILTGDISLFDQVAKENLIDNIYEDVFGASDCMDYVKEYLKCVAHKTPGMKVLEIGMGLKGMTMELAGALGKGSETKNHCCVYEYADKHPHYQKVAAEELLGISCHFLDIDCDPISQGFEPESYDLIIISSTLHGSSSPKQAMKSLRQLLKPGSKLVQLEMTKPRSFLSQFVLGLLPAWWLKTDSNKPPRRSTSSLPQVAIAQSKPKSPCLSEDQWTEFLSTNGFRDTRVMARDADDDFSHEVSVLVSTSEPRAVTTKTQLSTVKCVVVAYGQSKEAQILADGLKRILGGLYEQCDTLDLESALESGVNDRLCILLPGMERALLGNSGYDFHQVRTLLLSARHVLWLVNDDSTRTHNTPNHSAVEGLLRALRSEIANKTFVFLTLENQGEVDKQVQKVRQVIERVLANDGTQELDYREKDGVLCIPRAVEHLDLNKAILDRIGKATHKVLKFGHGPALKLHVESPGLLDSIRFIKDPERELPVEPEEVEIEVKATGLNFKDCLIALGKVNQNKIGGECAGIISRVGANVKQLKVGDRVTSCVLDTFKTYVRALADCCIVIPDDHGFDEAASWPANFVTAWHALCEVGKLAAGESILIHSAAGGTGQAAIQVAQYLGAEIFATVGTSEKKEFLTKEYCIPATHIFYSRDTGFSKSIKRLTKGNIGVDMVLNSLSGQALTASWNCIAPYGRFMEIGVKDINDNNPLPMSAFKNNVSFCAINIATMSIDRPWLIQRCLKCIMPLMQEGKLRHVEPLVRASVTDIEGAFRYLQSGKNLGKMVVTTGKEDSVQAYIETQPTYNFDSGATYVISGAFGGLGRSIARWLADRGARNLLLLSRSGARSQAALDLLESLQAQSVRVEAPPVDIADAAALKDVFGRSSLPPIKGCFQSAMVLRDAVFETMTYDDFKASTAPKIRGSWNLHTLCPQGMDFFVLLSSVTGIFGSPGQSNYCAGNTFMDALARLRTSAGEKAIALDLGVMASEGFLAENQDFMNRWIGPGYFTKISQDQLFAMLDYYCDPCREVLHVDSSQTFCGIETPANLRAQSIELPDWLHAPLFAQLHHIPPSASLAAAAAAAAESASLGAVDFVRLFAQAPSAVDAGAVVVRAIVERLAKALSIPTEEMQVLSEQAKSLQQHGVDSLIAVELRNWLARDFQAEVAIFDIMGAASLVGLGSVVEARSKLRKRAGEGK